MQDDARGGVFTVPEPQQEINMVEGEATFTLINITRLKSANLNVFVTIREYGRDKGISARED
ncbi:hypothetical protein ACINKY_15845 [Paenibacillus illinoisensis]|uniref:Uncharacterized protein n=1 Tax=Paenibacillus illinoisensis TaxID=59845 RepID=A0ABW8HVH7_9BACL